VCLYDTLAGYEYNTLGQAHELMEVIPLVSGARAGKVRYAAQGNIIIKK